jgi:thioredoxin family protein
VLLLRILVVVAFLLAVGLATRLYRARRAAVLDERPPHPVVPASLRAGAERTWVVFTTPYCASCGPVEEHLRAADPRARVVRVDATAEPHLAHAFRVRTAPTVVLADDAGRVRTRLVGAEAVREWALSRS